MQALTYRILFTVSLFFILIASTFAQSEGVTKASLYDRLGGVHAISAVVDDFVDRLWINEVLNANPKNKGAMGISKPALKYLATELVCMVTGGPQKYSGRGLKEVHQELNISEKEWDAMAMDFQASLNKFGVPEAEQNELFEIVGSTKADIVTVSE
jgi:hemoglobin